MTKIITDEKMIDEILDRGVEQIFPDRETLKKKLMSGEKIRLYCGYDPSASALHIGNAITINKLSQFQDLGHEVIFLVGDFTGMIGDPTDKSATRKKLTREEVLENAKDYQRQASGYLKFDGENPARVMYNSEWNDKMTFKDLIELSSNFTVQQMIQRDMFQRRIEEGQPIHLHEFLYPLTQGYDSVAMNVDLEIGGNDQMFNMLCGRDLQRIINRKEKFVVTLKLLADDQGKKMGKTEGNAVFLDQIPEDMYGKVMSWPDEIIVNAFELCTKIPVAEISEIKNILDDERNNPRDLKMKLAWEMVKINHGEDGANRAQEYFIKTVQKKEVPDEVKIFEVKVGEKLVDVVFNSGMAESKAEARRKIEQGGVSLDGEVEKDFQAPSSLDWNGRVVKVGKRDFRKISIV
jgi:tyrosyl-tRNA synthetase